MSDVKASVIAIRWSREAGDAVWMTAPSRLVLVDTKEPFRDGKTIIFRLLDLMEFVTFLRFKVFQRLAVRFVL